MRDVGEYHAFPYTMGVSLTKTKGCDIVFIFILNRALVFLHGNETLQSSPCMNVSVVAVPATTFYKYMQSNRRCVKTEARFLLRSSIPF